MIVAPLIRRTQIMMERRAADRQVARHIRTRPARIRVCWDLDNTLVASGELLQAGKRLDEAIVDAEPMPNMLEFISELRARLPDAEHIIVSARRRSMREATSVWLTRYSVPTESGSVCLVPDAGAKSQVWRELARDSALVVIDDLRYNHEGKTLGVYDDLVEAARGLASVYVGYAEIAEIVSDPSAAARIAAWAADCITRAHPRNRCAARGEQSLTHESRGFVR